MKRWCVVIKYFILLSLAMSSMISANDGLTIEVSVDNLRDSKGVVQFALYNKEGTVPDEKYQKYYRKHVEKISDNSSKTTFTGLKKGRYAINVLHDENSNGKIDKGFILPIEGVGFSNYSSISITNKVNFKKASFELNLDRKKAIKIIYF